MTESREARDVKRWLKVLVTLTVVLYVALIGLVAYVYDGANTNRDALCALRADLEKRVESSRTFLLANPKGVSGIPASIVQEQIVNQERTITALAGISCPAPPSHRVER